MTLDDVLRRALEGGGPVTIKDIIKRLEGPVRRKLDRLRVRGVVVREGRGGPYREFTYTLRPEFAAELGVKVRPARAKATPKRR
jgi:hypothetical protein